MSPQNSILLEFWLRVDWEWANGFWACLAAAALLQSGPTPVEASRDSAAIDTCKGNPADTWRWPWSYALWKGVCGCCSGSNVRPFPLDISFLLGGLTVRMLSALPSSSDGWTEYEKPCVHYSRPGYRIVRLAGWSSSPQKEVQLPGSWSQRFTTSAVPLSLSVPGIAIEHCQKWHC